MFKTTKYNIHHNAANREVLTEFPVLVDQQIFMSKVLDDRVKLQLLWG